MSSSTSRERTILLDAVTSQSEIIHIQSDVIDELFQIICQHLAADELDRLPVLEKISRAATIQKEVDAII